MTTAAEAAENILQGETVYCVLPTGTDRFDVRAGVVVDITILPSVTVHVSFGGVLQRPNPSDVFLDRDAAQQVADQRTVAARSAINLTSESLMAAFEILSEASSQDLASIATAVQESLIPETPPAPPEEDTVPLDEGTPKP